MTHSAPSTHGNREQLKVSRYTRLIAAKHDLAVLYNGYTGAVLMFTGGELQRVQHLLDAAPPGQPITRDLLHLLAEGDLLENLRLGGYLVPVAVDELQQVKDDYWASRQDSRFVLTVSPTFSCNLGCDYCFVGKKAGMMTRTKQDQLIEFVAARMQATRPSELAVDWYGGEPMLVTKVIDRLSQAFQELCEQYGAQYDGQIITNGTFLSADTPAFLHRNGITAMQITLDGPEEVHNQRRFYKVGEKSSFATIMAGLPHVIGQVPIRLRINVDQANLDAVWPLMDLFESKGWLTPAQQFLPYLAAVEPMTDACAHVEDQTSEQDTFFRTSFAWMRHLHRLGLPVAGETLYFFPDRKFYYCGAVGHNGFAVTPHGELHKCGMLVDESSEAIGQLGDTLDFTKPNLAKWMDYDPFTHEACNSCEFLPSCLGGCPKDRMGNREFLIKDNCNYHKQFEDKILAEHARMLTQAV